MAHFYDPHQGEAPLYVVEDKLAQWEEHHYNLPDEKLDHKWLGRIHSGQGHLQSAYQLKLHCHMDEYTPYSQSPCYNPTMWT